MDIATTGRRAKVSCSHEDCLLYPNYGPAPHECFWRKPGGFEGNKLGTSTILNLDSWPENFFVEIDLDREIEKQLSYGLCGVYVCPSCGESPAKHLNLLGVDALRHRLSATQEQTQ